MNVDPAKLDRLLIQLHEGALQIATARADKINQQVQGLKDSTAAIEAARTDLEKGRKP